MSSSDSLPLTENKQIVHPAFYVVATATTCLSQQLHIGPETGEAPKERLVHFDLKGAPAKIRFLKQLLTTLKTLGATGLLIEYEDMFPFEGPLANLSATDAYKKEDLKGFLETCALRGFTIMPLVQYFGHLEYALKLQEFSAMRETPESPQSIRPSRKQSMDFLEEFLRQVIEFHLQFVNELTTTLKMTHIHIILCLTNKETLL
uniref:Beta-N-acetylhexosaminidase n=1 Tax=Glossina pallidipes TaxID=7398 RepID=A0A1A9Z293_GLOPL